MKRGTFNLLVLILLVSSCNHIVETDLTVYSDNEEIYNVAKNEMKARLTISTLRSYITQELSDGSSSQDSIEVDSSIRILDYMAKIEGLSVTEKTKSFLYNLPVALVDNPTHSITLNDINSYQVPQEEKELMIISIAMIDAIKESEIYQSCATRAKGQDEYEAAIDDCLNDFYEGLGISVGEAIIAGGIGAYGGPVVAGVACAVVGVWEVAKTYNAWRKCKSRAERLLL